MKGIASASRESAGSNGSVGDAIEAERRRLAADFHDGPLQGFASFQMRLEIVRKLLQEDPGAAMKELLDLQELAHEQSREIRSFYSKPDRRRAKRRGVSVFSPPSCRCLPPGIPASPQRSAARIPSARSIPNWREKHEDCQRSPPQRP